MNSSTNNSKVAIVVADGFEQVEMTEPRKALEDAGFKTEIISPAQGKVKGWNSKEWGEEFDVDVPLEQAQASNYCALMLPGGVMNPDKLRRNEKALNFVREFFDTGKPVAAICHGPWTLIDAGVVKGRKMTSYPSIQMDLKNAGAHWTDQEVVVDHGLVTSRKPGDIPAFNRKMIEEFREGLHGGQKKPHHNEDDRVRVPTDDLETISGR
jgi:deglycase